MRDAGREGWIKASSLFQDDDQRLRDAVIAYGWNSFGTENRHLAASGFIIAYLTRLTYPLISQYVLERRVIDVSLSNVEFHVSNGRFDGTALSLPKFAALPGDPASGHPDAQIVRDDADLYERLKDRLFDSNFDVVIASLQRAARASVKVSWNAVAASCAQVFYRLYESAEDPELVIQAAEAFFDDPSSPVYRQVKMELIEHHARQGYFARRAGCCLFWRVRDSEVYCSGCILVKGGGKVDHVGVSTA